MSRLYGIKADEKRWEFIEIDNTNYHIYKLIDKEKKDVYYFNNVIGIEQVALDEFLVYRKVNYEDFEISRYKLQNSTFDILFTKRFNQFHFINDDRIMFTYWGNTGPYRCSGIYSIKDNKILEEAKWLDGTSITVYNDSENSNQIKLYAEEEISSYKLNNPKLLFTINPNTLQPNSDCYSQLRDSFIKVSTKEDIENIKLEEQKTIRIIEEQLYQKEREQLKAAKQKILLKSSK